MKYLEQLKSCKTQKELAILLGYSEKNFTRILFSQKISTRYQSFEIPKKTGSKRIIFAPNSELKILQTRLSIILSNCYEELEIKRLSTSSYSQCISSHGFRKKLTLDIPISKSNRESLGSQIINLGIYSNAQKHVGKRLVLNIDLKDFFQSITFSRIVGFFNKNKRFLLELDVSILIAQIATYRETTEEGFLPQGSPCSPIISNLIGNILDVKMVKLAKEYKFTYTRYVDDLTFSTNLPQFSEKIVKLNDNNWVIGSTLKHVINSSKFEVNSQKTRLTNNYNRQEVTGLTVNSKVNINKEYYRYTRSMVQMFCAEGKFFKSKVHMDQDKNTRGALNGVLSHIFQIKNKQQIEFDPKTKNYDELQSIEKLYTKFLFHNYFVHPHRMVVIGEGYTDPIHLKLACHKLYPNSLNFLKFSSLQQTKRFSQIMGYNGGTGLLNKFLENYQLIYQAKSISLKPCLIIVDGDKAGDGVIRTARSKFKDTFQSIRYTPLNSSSILNFFHVFKNLYIIQLPKTKVIEDLYDTCVTSTLIGTRSYNPSNKDFDLSKFYGKKELFEKIIFPNQNTINFSEFDLIFNTIFHIQLYHYIFSNSKN